MISLSFHTIIFQRKEWGKAMISLSLILLFCFFYNRKKNDVKHMISLSFHTIIFQRKEWGKAMISLSLTMGIVLSKTEERRKAHDQPVLPYYYISKKRMRESYDQSLPYAIVFSKTEARRKVHGQLVLPYYYISKKRMRESYDQSLPNTIVFFKNKRTK